MSGTTPASLSGSSDICNLPPYSPEFNPDEYLNQDYKSNVHKNGLPKNQKELKENTQNYMESLQNNPQKVANFFLHPSVKYAG